MNTTTATNQAPPPLPLRQRLLWLKDPLRTMMHCVLAAAGMMMHSK